MAPIRVNLMLTDMSLLPFHPACLAAQPLFIHPSHRRRRVFNRPARLILRDGSRCVISLYAFAYMGMSRERPLLPPMRVICFIIFLACIKFFSRRFTSATVVPDPLAMRFLREAFMIW